jgi:hypothetical protein
MATSFVSGNFALALDGLNCGMVKDVKGGSAKADVIATQVSSDYLERYNLGNLAYSDLEINLIGADSSPMTAWITSTLKRDFQTKSGQIDALDFKQASALTREFTDALVSGVSFPACKGDNKDATYLNVKLRPFKMRTKMGDGKAATASANVKQKMLTACNFKLSIDGFEDACKRINSVDAISWTQTVQMDQVGEQREYTIHPGKCSVSHLKISGSLADVQKFAEKHEDFVINGNCTDDKELIVVTMKHCGPMTLDFDPLTNNSDAINRFSMEFYVEEVEAAFSGIA